MTALILHAARLQTNPARGRTLLAGGARLSQELLCVPTSAAMAALIFLLWSLAAANETAHSSPVRGRSGCIAPFGVQTIVAKARLMLQSLSRFTRHIGYRGLGHCVTMRWMLTPRPLFFFLQNNRYVRFMLRSYRRRLNRLKESAPNGFSGSSGPALD
jgi:hypothetical protein